MICFPNCKINIGLNIIEKRSDGFHNIETIFYPTGLCDALEIIESKKVSINISGINIDGNTDDNLCLKAYKLIANDFPIPPVNIFLHKAIPTGAGLGGGSSDAAYMLFLLNKMFSLNISEEKLISYASQLGSDCAFFIKNTPVFASGKGEIMEPISLSLKNYYLVIVKPEIHIPTAKAYSLIKPKPSEYSLKNILEKNIHEWKNILVNDFEMPIAKEFAKILEIKNQLYNCGAVYASMTGSGSAVFGIFENEVDTKDIFKNYFVWQEKLK
ncbi:MAG TPA: 4-(cytidine 5'-diphospho)-2-C-methyl-D-erythritol kinase [Bacteroidales bacterium]|nr:4-(cytidine 5'-diphospho)-2-C-methyl-D-erythritol kinase [Bacteroidales bacterium]HPS16450.1 4-(cytidine 5'-diphospho)-2-C-methyl-D-erythritol kinase [Bacteroidales bacterium]